jgi:hypothetical protein
MKEVNYAEDSKETEAERSWVSRDARGASLRSPIYSGKQMHYKKLLAERQCLTDKIQDPNMYRLEVIYMCV